MRSALERLVDQLVAFVTTEDAMDAFENSGLHQFLETDEEVRLSFRAAVVSYFVHARGLISPATRIYQAKIFLADLDESMCRRHIRRAAVQLLVRHLAKDYTGFDEKQIRSKYQEAVDFLVEAEFSDEEIAERERWFKEWLGK